MAELSKQVQDPASCEDGDTLSLYPDPIHLKAASNDPTHDPIYAQESQASLPDHASPIRATASNSCTLISSQFCSAARHRNQY